MKGNLLRRAASSVLIFTAISRSAIDPATAATTTTPAPTARVRLVPTSTNSVSLSISNSGDQVWIIQSSSNFVKWTNVTAWKIHNGSYQATFTGNGTPDLFFRAFYDPTQQNIFSTTSNALLLPATYFNYAAPVLPATFSQPQILAEDNTPSTNVTSNAGAMLGRVLFYDKRLSTNQTIACASCHQQSHGFSDTRQFSVGYNGSVGTRHAMRLAHGRWYQRKAFFWDERAATLEAQVLLPIQNPIEMGMTLDALTNRLAAEPFYTNLFASAFGTTTITSNLISSALAQFVRSIVSVRTKYDIGETNNFANFTQQEILGRQIFLGQVGHATCAACHGTDNFVPTVTLNNNGLEYPCLDLGVGGITGRAADMGKFKVPSLRNIGVSGPYMHDGRFTNLAQVVEFYNSGVVANSNLSPPLVVPGTTNALRLNLSDPQKAALVAFLNTLTDTNTATDQTLSDPFNYGN